MQAEARTMLRAAVLSLTGCSLLVALVVQPAGALFPALLGIGTTAYFLRSPLEDLGELEWPGIVDYGVLFGGLFFLLVTAVGSAVTNSYGAFFVLVATILSVSLALVRWKSGLALFLFTGVFGGLVTFVMGPLIMIVLGAPWFLSAVITSGMVRYADYFTEEISADDIRDIMAGFIAFGLILILPIVTWGVAVPYLQPEWTMAEMDLDTPEDAGSGSYFTLGAKLVLFIIAGIVLMMGVYWVMSRLDNEPEEVPSEVEIPDDDMEVDKTTSGNDANLQRVVRGGRKAEVLRLVHEFLNRLDDDRARDSHETVGEFFRKRFHPEFLDADQTRVISYVYAGARYGFREPEEAEVQQIEYILEGLTEDE
jgi:hypothetical protein